MNKFKAGSEKVLKFLKQNSYYVIMGICLIAIITMISVAVVNSNKQNSGNVNQEIPNTEEDDNKKPTPEDEKIVFGMPVEDCEIGQTFTDKSTYYNEYLKQNEEHPYVDFLTNGKVEVKAVLDGEVEDIKTRKDYQGTIVTIKHKNGIRTIYQSLDKEVSVKIGDQVKKGDIIGKTSDSETRQKHLGNHLTLKVSLDNVFIDPSLYLTYPEK